MEKEKKLKRYNVEYWEHSAVFRDVYAYSKEEAIEKMKALVDNGKIDFSTELEVGDCDYDVIDETECTEEEIKAETGEQ